MIAVAHTSTLMDSPIKCHHTMDLVSYCIRAQPLPFIYIKTLLNIADVSTFMAGLLDAFGDKLEDLGLPRAPDTGATYNELSVVPSEWAPICMELFGMVRLA